ncbi:MAG: NAD(+) synthase [Bacteroidales bacterium]|nr:NAD(+) synthase [Bacteroidales bacterium]
MTDTKTGFHKEILQIPDIEKYVEQIVNSLRDLTLRVFNRQGAVVGISGGIDSSVSFALAVRAFGPERVLGIMLPEKDSSPDSKRLALELAQKFGVRTLTEDITGALQGFGCYERRDEAVKRVFPEYDPKIYTMKIGIKSAPNSKLPPIFSVVIVDQQGNEFTKKLPAKDYLQIVASSNFKQRTRMAMLYYHAECMRYAVIGTPNKHEVEQGFFVKYGDSGTDIMPISHLYKTQVYQFARHLGIPQEIIDRTPTSDTYSAEQTQEEFFFQMPFKMMDLLWYGFENNYDIGEISKVLEIPEDEILNIFSNFRRKKETTEFLRMPALKVIDDH